MTDIFNYGRPSTIRTKNCLFNKWVQPLINQGTIEEFDEVDFQRLIIYWEAHELAPNTIRSLISITKQWVEHCGGPKIQSRRLTRIAQNKKNVRVNKALDKPDVRELLITVSNMFNNNVFLACMLGYHGGLRKGEVFGLQWDDVDLFEGTMLIQRSYDGPTKNGQSRIIPLSATLQAALINRSINVSEGEKRLTTPFNPGPLLRRACKRANIQPITFHGFRHSFATIALESGKSPKEVQVLLGHSKLSTTIDIYWNLLKPTTKVDFT